MRENNSKFSLLRNKWVLSGLKLRKNLEDEFWTHWKEKARRPDRFGSLISKWTDFDRYLQSWCWSVKTMSSTWINKFDKIDSRFKMFFTPKRSKKWKIRKKSDIFSQSERRFNFEHNIPQCWHRIMHDLLFCIEDGRFLSINVSADTLCFLKKNDLITW